MSRPSLSEYDFEPVRGLPAELPAGEQLLWQGAPQWRSMARQVFHTRKIAVYFGILLVWRLVSALADGAGAGEAIVAALWLLPLIVTAMALLLALAWGYSRSTVYTITSRRVVIRFGIALPMTINIPFSLIGSAALKSYADGSGDLPLVLNGKHRMGYLVLWPNARPWHFSQPQPMLRTVADAAAVAELLADALAATADSTTPRISKVSATDRGAAPARTAQHSPTRAAAA